MGGRGSSAGTQSIGGMKFKKGSYETLINNRDMTGDHAQSSSGRVTQAGGFRFGVSTRSGTTHITELSTGMLVGSHDGNLSTKTVDVINSFVEKTYGWTTAQWKSFENAQERMKRAKERDGK